METSLTLNKARVLFFSKVRSQCKSTLGCYIVKIAASIIKVSSNAKLL